MKKITLPLIFFGFGMIVQGQSLELQTISNAGGHLTSTNGTSMNVTVGEVATERLSGNGVVLTQGFNQVFKITTSTQNDGSETISLEIFPNPTPDVLNVISDERNETLKIQIIGMNGKPVLMAPYSGGRESIDIQHLPSGSYIIKVINADGKLLGYETIQKI